MLDRRSFLTMRKRRGFLMMRILQWFLMLKRNSSNISREGYNIYKDIGMHQLSKLLSSKQAYFTKV